MKIRPLWIGAGAVGLIAVAASLHDNGTKGSPLGRWTKSDVQQLCKLRWKDDTKRVKVCVGRHKSKIGHDKTAADVKEIATGVAPHAAKKHPAQGSGGFPLPTAPNTTPANANPPAANPTGAKP